MSKALVVLSGGQDSTTCLFWAKEHYEEIHAISFDYGQRHRIELDAAATVGRMAGVKSHEFVHLEGLLKSTSPLTDPSVELEKYEDADKMAAIIGGRVELTFVPMRNTLFLTVAMNRAYGLNCKTLVTGICEEDNANYPDCTDFYREAFEDMANQSLGLDRFSGNGFLIAAPLMNKSKAETVKLAQMLDGCMEALAYSHTSYDGKYPPIDMNHANVLRAKGFEDAGVPDPLVVRAWTEGLMELPMTGNYDMLRIE